MKHAGLAPFALMLALLLGCTPGGSSRIEPTPPSPTVEAGRSPPPTLDETEETVETSPTAPQSDCPTIAVACSLAADFLDAIRTSDLDRIAQSIVPQDLECPTEPLGAADPRVHACAPEHAGSVVPVFEIQNGKAPLYFEDLGSFEHALPRFFHEPGANLIAVGCGGRGDEAVDCAQAVVAVYRSEAGSFEVGLVFVPEGDGRNWAIQKIWHPWPNSIPPLVPPAMKLDIFTYTGINRVELHPFATR